MAVYDFLDRDIVTAYSQIQWDGVDLPRETILNFIAPNSITVADDALNDRTNVTFAANLEALAAYSTNGILVYTGSNTFVGRTITGTSGFITVTNGDGVSGNPTITIDSTYAGQTSINTVGTITTGTWHGNVVTGTYGGTGVNNGSNTITLGGNINTAGALTTLGAYGVTFTFTNTTSVTFPTSGTLATTSQLPTLPLSIANGGTGQTTATAAFDALSPLTTQGDIIYYNGTHNVRLAAGTSGYVLTTQGASANPIWESAATVGALLIANNLSDVNNAATSFNNISPLTTKGDLLVYGSSNARLGVGTDGYILEADSSQTLGVKWAAPSAAVQAYQTIQSSTTPLTQRKVLNFVGASAVISDDSGNTSTDVTFDTNLNQIAGGTWTGASSITTLGTIATGVWAGTTIAVTHGGTGLTSCAQGDLFYGSASNTIAALAKDTNATRYLSNTGTSNNPAWAQVSLTNGATGTLQAAQFPALTGDVTTSAGSLATTIAANAVTYAKFQQVAAVSLIGNATGSLANATGITLGATLAFVSTALQTVAMTGDVTTSANSFATTIAAGAVTNAKMANMANNTIKGNVSGGTAAPSDITVSNILDILGTAQGDIIYRDSSTWQVLAPGTSGTFLQTQGASANPVWASAGSSGVTTYGVSYPIARQLFLM